MAQLFCGAEAVKGLRWGAIAACALLGCGRTLLRDETGDAGFVTDAGFVEVHPQDAGTPPPWCPVPAENSGRVWGTTPLGNIDFKNVWVGTEGPGSHSCPHLTVFASVSAAPDLAATLVVDFPYGRSPTLGPNKGAATLTLNGQVASIDVSALVTRADVLTAGAMPSADGRTSLTFAASDGGWTMQGVLTEVPDCWKATWFCL